MLGYPTTDDLNRNTDESARGLLLIIPGQEVKMRTVPCREIGWLQWYLQQKEGGGWPESWRTGPQRLHVVGYRVPAMFGWKEIWGKCFITLSLKKNKMGNWVVVQLLSCVWLCDPRGCTKFLCLPLSSWVCSDSCPLSGWCYLTISSSVTPFSFCLQSSQHQGPFQWVDSSHQVAKVLELQLQHQSFQWIFRVDFL